MPAFQIQVQGLLDGATAFIVPDPIPAPTEGGVIKIDAGAGINVGTFDLSALARTDIPLWLRAYHVECATPLTRALRSQTINPGSRENRWVTPDIAPIGDPLLMPPFQLAKQIVIRPGDTLRVLTDDTSASFGGAPVAGPHFVYFDLVPIVDDEMATQIEELAAYADLRARAEGEIFTSVQQVAASGDDFLDLVSVPQGVNQPTNSVAQIQEMSVIIGDAAAAGESMVINVRREFGGASAIVGTVTIDNTVAANSETIIPLLLPQNRIVEGSTIRVERTYVAGMAPTPLTNTVVRVEMVPQQLTQQRLG